MSDVEGRTALVTGAGGFIGAHLASALVEAGGRVRGFVRYDSRGDRGALEWVDPAVATEIEVVAGELRDIESVTQAVRGTDVVFHLGAQVAIPYSYVNPRDFFEVNVIGSLNVAQASLAADVSSLVHASTSEVYGSAQTTPITETHQVAPRSPYAASKVGADKLMESFNRAYDLPVTIVRPFNTYGPFQSARAIIPTIIAQALDGDRVKLGSLEPRRDFTYITDTVAGFLAAADAPAAAGRTIQLGTGEDVSVAELVGLVGDLLGRALEVELDPRRVRSPRSELPILVSSPSLAAELIGWEPSIGLQEGLERTIRWIEDHRSGYRPAEYAV
jgi:dTDP-glucose 4,6-dehydratase